MPALRGVGSCTLGILQERTQSADGPNAWTAIAVVVFLAVSSWLSSAIPAWHEGVSVHPGAAARVLESPGRPDATPVVRFEPSCHDHPGAVLRSEVRPVVKLCQGGRQLPVMISPYASGVPYWPSVLAWSWHRGNVFTLRWFGIAFGLASLLVTTALVRRLGGRQLGRVAAVLIAITPSFVFLHATVIHYETLPWLAIAIGVLVLARCPELAPRSASETGPSTPRLLGAAACFALAVLANVKAVFLLGPLVLVAWRAGVRFGRIDAKRWIGMAVVTAVVLLPMVLATLGGPEGVEGQVDQRLSALARNLRPLHVAAELLNVGLFGADMLWYLLLASGNHTLPNVLAVVVVVPAVLHCMIVSVRFFVRRSGCPITAGCGALLATFWLVSALLYDQFPAANHSPLCAVYGVAMACSGLALARWIAARRPTWSRRAPLAVVAPVALVLAWSSVGRGSPERFVTASINAHAERALTEHLVTHPEPSGTLLTTTYNLAGIFESLGEGELSPVQAHVFLSCPGDELGCLVTRFRTLFETLPLPMRIVVPARAVPIDESHVSVLPEAIRAATADTGLALRREAAFTTTDGVEVLWLYRVEPVQK